MPYNDVWLVITGFSGSFFLPYYDQSNHFFDCNIFSIIVLLLVSRRGVSSRANPDCIIVTAEISHDTDTITVNWTDLEWSVILITWQWCCNQCLIKFHTSLGTYVIIFLHRDMCWLLISLQLFLNLSKIIWLVLFISFEDHGLALKYTCNNFNFNFQFQCNSKTIEKNNI